MVVETLFSSEKGQVNNFEQPHCIDEQERYKPSLLAAPGRRLGL